VAPNDCVVVLQVTLRELYELGENVTDNTLLLFAQLLQVMSRVWAHSAVA